MREMVLKVFIIPWKKVLHLTFSEAVRPSSFNGWLNAFLNEFNVSQAVIGDLHCEGSDVNFI